MLNILYGSKGNNELEETVTMNLLDNHFIFYMLNALFIFYMLNTLFIFYMLNSLTYQGVFKLNICVIKMFSNISRLFSNLVW